MATLIKDLEISHKNEAASWARTRNEGKYAERRRINKTTLGEEKLQSELREIRLAFRPEDLIIRSYSYKTHQSLIFSYIFFQLIFN